LLFSSIFVSFHNNSVPNKPGLRCPVHLATPSRRTATAFLPARAGIPGYAPSFAGFRWSFYSIADVSVGVSLGMAAVFLAICAVLVWRIFKTGYRLKT
jgi:hypothetical protein